MSKRTPLYEAHVAAGARMIEFAGWEMPVQYTGVLEEHKTVRRYAGLFDLSHMGELFISGPDALEALQYLTTNDAAKIDVGQAQYSLLCLPTGGIVDDIVIYRLEDGYMVVVNAANSDKDVEWIQSRLRGDVTFENRSANTALLAVQGPLAAEILAKLTTTDLDALYSFEACRGQVAGVDAIISRTGYTGEDGFELYFDDQYAVQLWTELLRVGTPLGMAPVGLGARDTLRLEAKLSLYGNDLDENTTPLEAGLSYFVRFEKEEFIGREALLEQKAEGIRRKLVGFVMQERGIPRHGYPLLSASGEKVGVVTSGSVSPSTGKEIGLGYVQSELAVPGETIYVEMRGKARAAEIIKGRFVAAKTRRRP
ncbi:MAG TPA: glycine cleavage system aminomethyltransferase GcvT [Firmicutes bacterium]|jgi:aminomethyltransferase|nr:glycine cleavage system aminomethyltransferase GcvT [Bacillota bacterium]